MDTEQVSVKDRAGNPWRENVEPVYSLKDMVSIFESDGIEVSCSSIGDLGVDGFGPTIHFRGDWATGERIAQIARQHEFPVYDFGLVG